MKRLIPKATLGLILIAGGLFGAPGWAVTTVLLNANFNDKPLNVPIGTGGPTVGEPIFVHPLIVAKVQATPGPTRSLHIAKPSGTGYSSVDFELPGSVDIVEGDLRVAFSVRAPATVTNFRFGVSERGNSLSKFGKLELTSAGNVVATDAGGSAGSLRTFVPNETLDVEYLYRLDTRTYDLRINNVLLLDNRAHGVANATEGIGRLVIATDQTLLWVVDDVIVTHTSRLLLKADFNDKPLNSQIGTGGASLGEPV